MGTPGHATMTQKTLTLPVEAKHGLPHPRATGGSHPTSVVSAGPMMEDGSAPNGKDLVLPELKELKSASMRVYSFHVVTLRPMA